MSDKVPAYIYKLALDDTVISKGMVELLKDFNLELDEDKALKLFYSILAHMINHLDTHPGQYFKLKFLDIVADGNNFLCVKRNSEYTADTVTPQMFYERFCGSAVLKEELKNTLDLFAKSFLGIKEDKQRQRKQIDNLLSKRKALSEEIEQCTDIPRHMTKQKRALIKIRKEEGRKLKAYAKKKYASCFSSSIEFRFREKNQQSYETLKAQIQELWGSGITLKEILDKTI